LFEYEDDLSEAWTSCIKRKLGGYKKTTAISRYINELVSIYNYDFVFFDTGPNIGPLNRIILLDCDYFIIPSACDVFSVRALKTLGKTFVKWIIDWKTIKMLAPDKTYLMKGYPQFLGYIPQQFRVYGGLIASEFRTIIPKIEKNIESEVIVRLNRIDPLFVKESSKNILGQIQNFSSLAVSAQVTGVPFWLAEKGTNEMRTNAKTSFKEIAQNIIKMTN